MGSNEVEEFYEDPESLEERFPKTRKRSRRLAAVNLHYCFANGASYLHGHSINLHKRGCRGNILSVAVYHLPEFSTETYSRKVVLKKQKFAETEPGEILNCNVAGN